MKSSKKTLDEVVKNFLKGNFETGLAQLNTFSEGKLTPKDQAILNKLLGIYMLGQLLNLPTLHSILEKKLVKKNRYQIKYNNLLNNISHQDFIDLFESCFKQVVKSKLIEMCKKDSSIWSKTQVTLIIDDSIFKQWIKDLLNNDIFYGCFFSGQSKSKVYGFKVLCFGVSIEEVFYPLFMAFVPKKVADKAGKNIAENACKVAEGLLEKWALLAKECEKEGFLLPKFYLSCDNGYSDIKLAEACQKNNIIYISVPKKNHRFTIESETKNLSNFALIFEENEKKHNANCEKNKEAITPYIWRVRGKYEAKSKKVVLLFFRLNNSKKVSIIYTTDTAIFAKTLRRHWFDRTYIAQFFKLLKHSMKIQNTLVKTKITFENKLYIFMFLGLYLQLFVKYIRTQFDFGLKRKIGLEALKRQLIFNSKLSDMLDELLQTKI